VSEELRIPIVEEEARLFKRSVETERVSVRTSTEEQDVIVRDTVEREHVEVTRVPVNREVATPPEIRTEGEVTIVPIVEERLVVEKRLFVIEELHLRRTRSSDAVALPATLRRTRVDVAREDLNPTGDH
jgi:stress response protein YsnF